MKKPIKNKKRAAWIPVRSGHIVAAAYLPAPSSSSPGDNHHALPPTCGWCLVGRIELDPDWGDKRCSHTDCETNHSWEAYQELQKIQL